MRSPPNVLAALLGLLAGLGLASCGVPSFIKSRCTASTCQGCCDSDGLCLGGKDLNACGASAVRCATCVSGQVCEGGLCKAALGGGAGGNGGGTAGSGGFGGAPPDGGDGCIAEAKLVYVVDINNTFSSFDPSKVGTGASPFTELGRLSCPAYPGATPFSMSVDRNAVGWVVYDDGELFTVEIKNALRCTKTAWVPQGTVARFGMGFVSDAPGSTAETLYVSGSPVTGSLNTTTFGTLDTATLRFSALGTLSGAPELTGTGDAKLFAFFPNVSPPRVSQLAKANGATLSSFDAPTLAGRPLAWAFAFWGGDYWIFLQRDTEASTQVYQMKGQTGVVSTAVPSTGRTIVGAGVSTCAPITIN